VHKKKQVTTITVNAPTIERSIIVWQNNNEQIKLPFPEAYSLHHDNRFSDLSPGGQLAQD